MNFCEDCKASELCAAKGTLGTMQKQYLRSENLDYGQSVWPQEFLLFLLRLYRLNCPNDEFKTSYAEAKQALLSRKKDN